MDWIDLYSEDILWYAGPWGQALWVSIWNKSTCLLISFLLVEWEASGPRCPHFRQSMLQTDCITSHHVERITFEIIFPYCVKQSWLQNWYPLESLKRFLRPGSGCKKNHLLAYSITIKVHKLPSKSNYKLIGRCAFHPFRAVNGTVQACFSFSAVSLSRRCFSITQSMTVCVRVHVWVCCEWSSDRL